MLTREQNELLCRVEGGATMGQIMRRHWLPLCMAEEAAARDGAPVRSRLLGEDLVVFRDSQGRLGVLDEHCPHRGASLAFGRNEECGLRCLYHGWKFAVDGEVLDMASEPEDSALRRNFRHRAYPVREAGGFVWVWLGDPDAVRPFYVRTTLFIAPFTVLIPPNDRYKLAQMLVPIDDVNTMFYWIAWHESGGIDQDAWRAFCNATPGVDLDENWRKLRNASNRY